MDSENSPAVVLTRQHEDNQELAAALRALGVAVREIPCLATKYLYPQQPIPMNYDAVVFTSRRGVRGFFHQKTTSLLPSPISGEGGAERRVRGKGIDHPHLRDCYRTKRGLQSLIPLGAHLLPQAGEGINDSDQRVFIAAVGQATASEIQSHGLQADIVADPPEGAQLASLLKNALPVGSHLLMVRGNLRSGEIDSILEKAGYELDDLIVYENVDVPIAKLQPFPVAAVFIASPSAAKRLLSTNTWIKDKRIFAIGNTTARVLKELGSTRVEDIGADPHQWTEVLFHAYQQEVDQVKETMDRSRAHSAKLYERALRLMPGGVSSPVRAFHSVSGTPIYFRDAQGARFHDEDGHTYVDYCMSWGPLILGHSHPLVVEAVHEAAAAGLSYGACSRREVELAELILSALPNMDQIRFVSSGTEAVMTAIRLARGVTGRSKILKFEGGYHGHCDSLLVKAGSGLATFGASSSLGVTEAVASETIVCPFDNEQILAQAFNTFGAQLAAAIVEPLPANNGLLEQRPEWLRLLRELCSRNGALLIFDEVISGFRLRFGGCGDSLGIPADLITLGKIIGGGMPVGALVGSKQLMENLAPLGNVYQAGTLSGNPVSMAAGTATLTLLRDGDIYHQVESLGQKLDQALQEARTRLPVINWRRVGSVIWLHLAEGLVPRSADTILPEAVERFKRLHSFSLGRGIYLPPSAYEVLFLSAAHSQTDMKDLAETITEALL